MQSCVHIRSSVFPKIGKKEVVMQKSSYEDSRLCIPLCICMFRVGVGRGAGRFSSRLSASARPTALIEARRRPSTPHPRGKAAGTQNKQSALQQFASVGRDSSRKPQRRLRRRLTLVSHCCSFSFLSRASALCFSSSRCLASVAASMSFSFRFSVTSLHNLFN